MGYLFPWPTLSKLSAEEWLNRSEILIILAGFVLAFGAIGEYLESHNRLPKWMAWPKLAFILMVVISLMGEFVGDAGVFVFSKELQRIEGNEIDALDKRAKAAGNDAVKAVADAAEATKKSQDALSSASDAARSALAAKLEADSYEAQIKSALAQATKAENDLADAREKAAKADEHALAAQQALDEYRAPRLLTESEQKRIGQKLTPSKVQNVWIAALPLTVDSGEFAKQILAAVLPAWPQARMFGGDPTVLSKLGAVSGVVVVPTHDPRSVSAGDALIKALQGEHVLASRSPTYLAIDCDALHKTNPGVNLDDPYCFSIMVLVGPKP
jgi:hypothetical protein